MQHTEYGFFDLSNDAIEETLCSTDGMGRGRRRSDLRELPSELLAMLDGRPTAQKIGKQIENPGQCTLLRCSRLCNGNWEMKETPMPLSPSTCVLSREPTRSVNAELGGRSFPRV